MRVISLLVFLGVALVSSASAVAQGSETVVQNQNYSAPLFSKLFAIQSTPPLNPSAPQMSPEETARARAALQALRARPTVTYRCGMALVPVDPSFDAKIRRPVPAGRFTIKRMKPPVCGQ